MKKIQIILFILITAMMATGCKASVEFDEEFSLSIGKGAVISKERLEITFLDVLEDSRCPRDATCISEGRATILVRLASFNTEAEVKLIEPGLSDHSGTVFVNYLITYHLLPYPQSGAETETARGDYRLVLTISKTK